MTSRLKLAENIHAEALAEFDKAQADYRAAGEGPRYHERAIIQHTGIALRLAGHILTLEKMLRTRTLALWCFGLVILILNVKAFLR